jgi:hypothetical protein
VFLTIYAANTGDADENYTCHVGIPQSEADYPFGAMAAIVVFSAVADGNR